MMNIPQTPGPSRETFNAIWCAITDAYPTEGWFRIVDAYRNPDVIEGGGLQNKSPLTRRDYVRFVIATVAAQDMPDGEPAQIITRRGEFSLDTRLAV